MSAQKAIAADPQPISAQSPDVDLAAALRDQPGLLSSVRAEATRAYQKVMKTALATTLGIPAFWSQFTTALGASTPNPHPALPAERLAALNAMVRQLRLALEARDLLEPLLHDLGCLCAAETMTLNRHRDNPGALAQAIAAAAAAHPGLAAWRARQTAAAARINAAQQALADRQTATLEAQRATERAEAARGLLGRLAGAGVHLAAAGGELLAHPAPLLTPTGRREVVEYRAELMTLLASAPEAIA